MHNQGSFVLYMVRALLQLSATISWTSRLLHYGCLQALADILLSTGLLSQEPAFTGCGCGAGSWQTHTMALLV